MQKEDPKNSSHSNVNSKPNSQLRLGLFIFITALATSLIVGGVVYAWQQKKFQDLRAEKDEEIKNLKEELNSLEAQIETLQNSSSKNTQKSSSQSYFGDWKTKHRDNFSFKYPNRIDGDYISTTSQNWPPKVIIKEAKADELICEPGENKIVLSEGKYCFNKTSEGTAGITYKRYSWRTIEDKMRVSLIFGLKFPSCGAMPEADNCSQVQSGFDPNNLTKKIFKSVSYTN